MTGRPVAAGAEVLPLHLSVGGRRVVVVGGGRIGTRKVRSLLAAAADILVVSPTLGPELAELERAGRISWRGRCFSPGDLSGAWLVFACTDSAQVNLLVYTEAEMRRVFCVRADNGARGSARSAAVVRHRGLVIGVSSGDVAEVDPRHVRRVRDGLAAVLV